MSAEAPASCPFHGVGDDRKSAAVAAQNARPDTGAVVQKFSLGKDILKSPALKQAGLGADQVVIDEPSHAPVFFLDGEHHRNKRSAIARFFTATAVETRHRPFMERKADTLLSEFRRKGRICLDQTAWLMAVAVASEVVGLNHSDTAGLARRIKGVMRQVEVHAMNPVTRFFLTPLLRFYVLLFHFKDVRPAIKARREQRKDDIISHLIDEKYSEPAILIECMTYAGAGMVTTREFITMVAWHFFERHELRDRYLNGSEAEQNAILEEILRLEPVGMYLYRRTETEVPAALAAEIQASSTYAIDVRNANLDESVTGPCPHMIDPDRASRMKVTGSYLSFGYGSHRCPGAQVALAETRIFIDRLFRIPGVRLEKPPSISWCAALNSYELRDAIVVCDVA